MAGEGVEKEKKEVPGTSLFDWTLYLSEHRLDIYVGVVVSKALGMFSFILEFIHNIKLSSGPQQTQNTVYVTSSQGLRPAHTVSSPG